MSVSGFAPAARSDISDARDSRSIDDESAASFAGVLANVMQPATPAPQQKTTDDGTSDLDQTRSADDTEEMQETQDGRDAASETNDGDATVSKASHKHPRHASTTSAKTSYAGSSGSTTDVVRSVGALDPALQDKLARVMSRMQNETGLQVNVAETYRSQARQDALYSQGRDTAGPVVTWTHNSQHTAGRAVDVTLSGGTTAQNPDAYATLQRIANEEGLHTLGARDPGHLELPSAGGTTAASDSTSLNSAASADASSSGQVSIARVAQLARVADVAAVAQPAQVAQVATAARAGQSARTATAADGASAPAPANGANGTTAASTAVTQVSSSANDAGTQQGSTSGGGGGRGQAGSGDARGYSAMAAAVAMRAQAAAALGDGSGSFGAAAVTAGVGTTSAERAAKILDAMENAPARPLSQITMSVDAGDGATDRIQLSLRGASLNATIDAADAGTAQAMNGRADELARALTRDGIDLQSLHVRSAASTVAAGGLAAGTSSQTPSDASNGSRYERNQSGQQQQDRQRSQQDRRNQQRQQRGDDTQ
ncbi:MAG TPA: hypothetical protein VHV78_03025 [Gemmatimonadaceae bacterium]|nr:hypothetical protein [Gemmatimonadaceae bacterium]